MFREIAIAFDGKILFAKIFGGKVFEVYSKKNGGKHVVDNPEVIVEIKNFIKTV